MKKIAKILTAAFVFSAFAMNNEAAIKESSSDYTNDTYIIGSTRINGNVTLSSELATQAGINEAIYKLIYSDDMSNQTLDMESIVYMLNSIDAKTYYYSALQEKWAIIDKDGGKPKYLNAEEKEEFENNLYVYYTYEGKESDGVKTINAKYDPVVEEGYSLAFVPNLGSYYDDVKYDEETKTLSIPALVTSLEVYKVNDNDYSDYSLLNTIERELYEEEVTDSNLSAIIEEKEEFIYNEVLKIADEGDNGVLGYDGLNNNLSLLINDDDALLSKLPVNTIIDDIIANKNGVVKLSINDNNVKTEISVEDFNEDSVLAFISDIVSKLSGKAAGLTTLGDLADKKLNITVTYKSNSGLYKDVEYVIGVKRDTMSYLIKEKEEAFKNAVKELDVTKYGFEKAEITQITKEDVLYDEEENAYPYTITYDALALYVEDTDKLVSELATDAVSIIKQYKDYKEGLTEVDYYIGEEVVEVDLSEVNSSNLTSVVIENAKAFLVDMSGKEVSADELTLGDLIGKEKDILVTYYAEDENSSGTMGIPYYLIIKASSKLEN